jgi:hypothetical protein
MKESTAAIPSSTAKPIRNHRAQPPANRAITSCWRAAAANMKPISTPTVLIEA